MLIESGNSTLELKENTIIVVLGASGDLAKKKTFPALFGLVWKRSQKSPSSLTATVPQ
jgi:glucose-6-phosphate 1-dehydrogenase